jgi:endoglucanase
MNSAAETGGLSHFRIGTNLGGWLSQYPEYSHEHFASFIKERNIGQIASWGMDHIRLPVDYPLFEDDERPFVYKDSGFDHVNRCMDWCEKHGLNVVLDLHRAPGFTFNSPETCSLFSKPEQQERFASLWREIARRFATRTRPRIIFELLNEIVLPSPDPWNRLAAKAIQVIREADDHHWIMVGGNDWNATWALRDLPVFDDPRTAYTFHFYEPLPFTHQKASWCRELAVFDKDLDYPGDLPGLEKFLDENRWAGKRLDRYAGVFMDKGFLEKDLDPALDFVRTRNLPLYCGEFGVIDTAGREGRRRWYKDFIDLLDRHSIGRACWSYKGMSFGLVDLADRVVDEELVKIVSSSGEQAVRSP